MAGRRGDFLTSPEVGPLFGNVVANALDAEWDRLDRPEDFTVVDFGAGPGTLARSVAAARPRCAAAMRYVAIERSAEQRDRHPDGVTSVDALTSSLVGDGLVGVVIANELLDNLAFAPVERGDAGLRYLDVEIDDGDALVATVGSRRADDELFGAEVDAAVVQSEASAWLRHVLDVIEAGRVIVLDYARTSSAEVEVRTFSEHGRAGDPLVALGTKDITVDVDLEQIQRVTRPADRISSQASWLRAHGLDELVDEGRLAWAEGAARGDLAALRGRSRVREGEALAAEDGLGGFTVAEWSVS